MKFIDLHCHLDGAITVEIAKQLAALQKIQLPPTDELKKRLTVPENCKDLNEFLSCFSFPLSLLQTKESLSEAVRLVCNELLEQGVIYVELRFAPQLHQEKGMSQEDAVQAALAGLQKTKLKANLILCCMRGCMENPSSAKKLLKENLETVELAKKYCVKDGGVVALDLAGAEALFATKDYEAVFDLANKYKIPFTIHAGEASGAESIKSAVEFGAKRIGHGIRLNEDLSLLKMVKEKNITLELCPTSNRQTQAIKDMSKYPIIEYLNQGLKVTINTDDPAIEGTTIAKEFLYVEKEFGLSLEQKKRILQNSVEAAFTTQEIKAALILELLK